MIGLFTDTNVYEILFRDFAMAFSRPYFEYVIKEYQGIDTGEPLMTAFKSNIITLPVEMITEKVMNGKSCFCIYYAVN